MKVTNFEDIIHVINDDINVTTVINNIVDQNIQEDAFYVCDVGDMVAKYKIWKRELPRVEPHYAVKCNDSPIVLSTLASLGMSFDCASKDEISKVLDMGVESSRIIFANPAKQASHIRYANSKDVKLMTFDSESELYKVKKLFAGAKMVLRIRYDAAVAQCLLDIKFGCDPVLEAPHLLQLAHKLGIHIAGISFQVGSGCGDPPVYYRAIEACKKLFDYAERELGFKMTLLDIGGGYPGDKGTSIDKIAYHVNRALDEFFSDDSVRIIAEPGRFFVASAYTLCCNVYATRTIGGSQDPNKHTMYFINDGIFGSFNGILYDDRKVEPQLLKYNSTSKYPSSIWGPSCDPLDVILKHIMLPKLNIDDWILFENMGDYTLSAASGFNGFPIPKAYLIIAQASWYFLRNEVSRKNEQFALVDYNIRLELNENCNNKQQRIYPELPVSLPIPKNDINGDQFPDQYLNFGKS